MEKITDAYMAYLVDNSEQYFTKIYWKKLRNEHRTNDNDVGSDAFTLRNNAESKYSKPYK